MIDLKKVIAGYSPDTAEIESVRKLSDDLMSKIREYCRIHGINADPLLVGSSSRGTSLRGADIDIFIRFKRSYGIREMEKLGLEIGHYVLMEGVEKYAEHPYVSSNEFGRKVDVVPCFMIDNATERITAVDRTPLHSEYLKTHLTDQQKDEVKLLKLFMRKQGIYGSELKTNGFSGYVTELLIVNYGSFLSAITHISNLKGKLVIGEPEATGKFASPVIIIDPTDQQRNAGAAVSLTALSILKLCGKTFLREPSESYFGMEPDKKPSKNVDRGTIFYIIRLKRPEIVDDIIFPQVQKMISSITRASKEYSFNIINSEYSVEDEIQVLLELETDILPEVKLHSGPPVESDNVIPFLEKNSGNDVMRGPYVIDGRIYVELKNSMNVYDQVLSKILENADLGKHINKMKGEFKIQRYKGKLPDLKVSINFLSKRNPN